MKKPQVIKISSKLQIHPDKERILANLATYIANSWQNAPSMLVISGAIVLGAKQMGISYEKLADLKKTLPYQQRIEFLQDLSGIGQPILEKTYSDAFRPHEHIKGTAQILFEEDDFSKKHAPILRNRINRYLESGVVPKFNANNTLDFYEVTKDNDEPGAKIAIISDASRYIMLTEEDGLYSDFKKKEGFLHEVSASDITECLKVCHDANSSNGGMESKLKAAKLAAEHGIETIIASYRHPLWDIIAGNVRSTRVVRTSNNNL